jgi:hypothetical protein
MSHKTAVGLDLVKRKTAQVVQGRVTSAEIVHCDAHAWLPQLVQRRDGNFIVLHAHCSGDLKIEALGRQLGPGEGINDL